MKTTFYYIAGVFSIWLLYCLGDTFFERKDAAIQEARDAAVTFVQNCEDDGGEIATIEKDLTCVEKGKQLTFFSFQYEPDTLFLEEAYHRAFFNLLKNNDNDEA